MDSGLYAAYTGLLARTQALDSASNNLANANTTGFRAQRDYFRGVMANATTDESTDSQTGRAVNSFGVMGGSLVDLGQGEISGTGNPLDLAIDGAGLFAVQTSAGIRYTRDGGFMRSQDGTLTTAHGEAVLDAARNKIVLPNGELQIAASGIVSVSTQEGTQIAGTIGLFNFSAKDLLSEGTNKFRAREGAPAEPATGSLQQGKIEGANQDAVHGTMQLMLMQRQAEMMQKALNVFNNEFDKTAAEELGKV